jgi:hypothetical protein
MHTQSKTNKNENRKKERRTEWFNFIYILFINITIIINKM